MPYIHTLGNSYTKSIRQFSLLVKLYQHSIEQDPVARCMVGFTAAQIIRDANFSPCIDTIENWLKSRQSLDSKIVLKEENSLKTVISILEDMCESEEQHDQVTHQSAEQEFCAQKT